MARTNHQFAKRQRELAKKKKKEDKLRKKRERGEGPDDEPGAAPQDATDESTGETEEAAAESDTDIADQ